MKALIYALESATYTDLGIEVSARPGASLHLSYIDRCELCYCTDVMNDTRIAMPHEEDLKNPL